MVGTVDTSLTIVTHGERSAPKVALTFDDGPNPHATPQVLDILKQESCTASFFLIGRWVEKYPALVKRILEEGHTIGGHTYMHGGDTRCESYSEFKKGNETIERLLGITVKFIRVPQFRYTSIDSGILRINELLMDDLHANITRRDLIIVDCTIDSLDWKASVSPQDILDNVFTNVTPGSIIGLHDSSEKEHELFTRPINTLRVLPRMIRGIKQMGFDLVNLDGLRLVFEQKAITVETAGRTKAASGSTK